MKKHMTFCELAGALAMLALPAFAAEISLSGDNVVLTFDNPDNATYTVQRSSGRFGELETIGTTDEGQYTDALGGQNAYDLYYLLTNEAGDSIRLAMETQLFGSNTYIFRPTDNPDSIANTINRIGGKMHWAQFSSDRYSFNFMPGDYLYPHVEQVTRYKYIKDTLDNGKIDTIDIIPYIADSNAYAKTYNIGYYTHICGLGNVPTDTRIQNAFALCPLSNNNATCTFWRSIENLRIVNVTSHNFWWGVSQAAPMRRIWCDRQTLLDLGGYASGGFAADCHVGTISAYSQQQWYSRNCYMKYATGSYGIPGWNHAYQGIEFGSIGVEIQHKDNWGAKRDGDSWGYLSNEPYTPIIREKPFLFYDTIDSRYKVFVPALRDSCKGISYTETDMGEGDVHDLLDEFYVAQPGVTAATLNAQLSAGKHLFLTPGIYEMEAPIHITRAGTIVIGIGYATLHATNENSVGLMLVDDVDGVSVASLLFDAGNSTQYLLKVGESKTNVSHEDNPSLFSDLFFRIGGVVNVNTNADAAVIINSDHVIGDHFWIWRADHSNGVGWARNTCKNGLIVNGDYVTIYGLFNEHHQEYQTLWNGEDGRTFFYQCETPYDVTSQAAYKSHDGTVDGWAAYKVSDNVKTHNACMMGIYDVLIRTGGKVVIENSIEVPNTEGVHIRNACNYGLTGGSGKGFRYVINGTIPSSVNRQYRHYHVLHYCMTGVKEIDADPDGKSAAIRMYPNPADEYIVIEGTDENPSVSIYTLGGSRIATFVGKQTPVANLPGGSYLVRVQDGNQSKVFKLIKQ